MALIEKYVVVAESLPVKAGEEIIEGMFVKLDSSTGEVVVADGTSNEVAIGVAGDTKSTDTVGLPTTNGSGTATYQAQAAFQNRVSDAFDETRASGRMTVYLSGGVFASNQYDASSSVGTYLPGAALYVSAGNPGLLTDDAADNSSSQIVAYVVKTAGAYDSGVPGLDVNGSMTLGNYIEFKLAI